MRIAEALDRAGIPWRDERVHGVPGPFAPIGIMWHHTAAGGSRDLPSLGTVKHGRPGLRGPLSQMLIGRAGTVVLVTEGRANHAGDGDARQLDRMRQGLEVLPRPGLDNAGGGNAHLIGIECENNGVGEPWTPELLESMLEVGAALCAAYGWDPIARQLEHLEWTRRKIDRANIDPRQFRRDVAARLTTGDDDLTPEQAARLDIIHDAVVLDDGPVRHLVINTARHVEGELSAQASRLDEVEDKLDRILEAVRLEGDGGPHTTINTVRANQEVLEELAGD